MTPDAPGYRDAARALACLDLTDLGDAATDESALGQGIAVEKERERLAY
jgi:hypothetical protein